MSAFRPYTDEELRTAAEAYGLNPDFVRAIYATESSSGTNPQAMKARMVKRKRDSTFVRGPFQLEDGTTADIIRKNKLGGVNIDDPDVHLDLALRHMKDLLRRYNGDEGMAAQAYHGFGKSETGETDMSYRAKVLAEMDRLRLARGDKPRSQTIDVTPTFDTTPYPIMAEPIIAAGAEPVDDLGIPLSMPTISDQGTWRDLVAANTNGEFALPMSMRPNSAAADFDRYLVGLVDEELGDRDFSHA